MRTLHKHRWHKGNTAKVLGVDPKTLYRKMKQLNIAADS
ncbi:helix-turn-helix domain-containing protein [Thermodesulfobacteriota bacterium]